METAKLVGQRSSCSRAQYGAVIVSEDNRVLAVGYNGPPARGHQEGPCTGWCQRSINASAGKSVDPDYLDCHAIHAEANALLRAPSLFTEKNPHLYVNGVTCFRCAILTSNSGLAKVTMLLTEYELKRQPDDMVRLLKRYGVEAELMHEP